MLREALRGGGQLNLYPGENSPFDSGFLRGVTGLSLGCDCMPLPAISLRFGYPAYRSKKYTFWEKTSIGIWGVLKTVTGSNILLTHLKLREPVHLSNPFALGSGIDRKIHLSKRTINRKFHDIERPRIIIRKVMESGKYFSMRPGLGRKKRGQNNSSRCTYKLFLRSACKSNLRAPKNTKAAREKGLS
jgi:hypothetical protein